MESTMYFFPCRPIPERATAACLCECEIRQSRRSEEAPGVVIFGRICSNPAAIAAHTLGKAFPVSSCAVRRCKKFCPARVLPSFSAKPHEAESICRSSPCLVAGLSSLQDKEARAEPQGKCLLIASLRYIGRQHTRLPVAGAFHSRQSRHRKIYGLGAERMAGYPLPLRFL